MNTQPIQLRASLWMTVGDENFGGLGRITLLTKIAEFGSITQAARAMHMSYKAAWDAVDMMNNLAGEPLVARQVGGKGGGGTALTPRGQQLVENFEHIKKEHQRFIEQLNAQIKTIADDPIMVTRVGMKTSARNQFLGRVTRIESGDVNDNISVACDNGISIVAQITRVSAHDLNLTIGDEVFVLLKAAAVQIVAPDARADGSNHFLGRISHLQESATMSDVVVTLTNGATLAANVAEAVVQELQLSEGKEVAVEFAAASVIIGVPV